MDRRFQRGTRSGSRGKRRMRCRFLGWSGRLRQGRIRQGDFRIGSQGFALRHDDGSRSLFGFSLHRQDRRRRLGLGFRRFRENDHGLREDRRGRLRRLGLLTPNCSVKYSAVILSSELDGTLAAAMPNSFALTSTSLLSMPSFFAMS